VRPTATPMHPPYTKGEMGEGEDLRIKIHDPSFLASNIKPKIVEE